jgi:hypothetical protein
MKSKGLIFISCLAAGALIASPSSAKPAKKSAGKSMSKTTRMSAHTTKVMPGYRHQQGRQNISSRAGNTGYYAGTRYTGTRSYAGRQYSGTRYYGGTPNYYGRNNYYGGTQYYNGGHSYGSYPVWPYVAASVAPYVASSLWAPGYYGSGYYGYPYSSYGGYPNNYSYYGSGYGYAGSTVAAVQRRLGELGYYHGVVDGAIGPRTRSAIAAFESRHGLIVDGRISRPLLNRLGLA